MMNLQFDLKFVLRGEGEGKEEEEIVERRREWILWASGVLFSSNIVECFEFFVLFYILFPIDTMIENGKIIYVGVVALDRLGKMINTSLKILQFFIFSEIQK